MKMRIQNLLLTATICASCFSCTDNELHKPVDNGKLTGPQVPEGFSVEVVADSSLVDYPMFSTLDEYGRLFVFESTGNVYDSSQEAINNPQFRIKLLTDTNSDGRYDKATIYADKVGFPQGGVFYKGSLIASSAPDLIKFTDTNDDGVADKREVMLSGWILNVNANSLVGPSMSPDGWLYMTNAIMGFDVTTREGERLKGETSRTWRVKPDGSQLEWISAGGMNNPVELTYTEAAEPIGTETYFTNPKGGERDALVYWVEGGVYPKPNDNITRDKLVRTGELMPVVTKYSRVSPAGIGRYRNDAFGKDFRNNLFSAQFNTHRVMRHKLFREGASFRTEDEIFFFSNNEDFHPTDVQEDADGSLLIVETGGWFIKGCPLSQQSKPELKGAIYRVRKNGARIVQDPYGNNIKWQTVKPEDLTQYLEKENSFIADRAQQALVDLGYNAIAALKNLMKNSSSADARTKAVFTLYRIGLPGSLAVIHDALTDKNAQVAVAAARSLGLAKDKRAAQALINLLGSAPDPVKRQAATALAQINYAQAVAPLLGAAEKSTDRFVRHAIIHSLALLNDVASVRQGLAHQSPNVREAALIVLDQMHGSPLTAQELIASLTDNDEKLQETALWIASHHPEWSTELIAFLRNKLNKDSFNLREEKLYSDILVSFSEDARMQQFIASQLKAGSAERKLFFLHTMGKARVKKFPDSWVSTLRVQFSAPANPQLKAEAIKLVHMHNISSFDNELKQIGNDNDNTPSLRIQALSAVKKGPLSDSHFNFLYEQLTSKKEASFRQQAASVLEQSKLSEKQLQVLADNYLPSADPSIVPRIVPVFAGTHSAEVGKTVAGFLLNSPTLDGFSVESIKKLFEKYPPEVQPAVDQLIAKLNVVRAGRLEKLREYENNLEKGVLDSGRALFFGKATCSTCHSIGAQGGSFGPDLTSIQRDRSVHDLLEAIVYPGASFVREYETYKIISKSDTYTGIIRSMSPEVIMLETSPQSSVRIATNDIISTEIVNVSMMPQGLDKILSPQEMADLMTFLIGQDQDPETDQRILRHTSAK